MKNCIKEVLSVSIDKGKRFLKFITKRIIRIYCIMYNFFLKPDIRFGYLSKLGMYNHMSDESYLKKLFRIRLGYDLDLKNPETFNEKIQWLKIYDRKPVYVKMVDKIEAKKYVATLIGEQYIIPTIGVWESPDEIDFNVLPDKFVLKCNHNSGRGMYICRDKSILDKKKVKKELRKGLKENYYYLSREWPYKGVKPKILAEKLLSDDIHLVPEDYKVYCFGGEPKYIVVFHNRFAKNMVPSETVYDLNWQPQNISLDKHFIVSDIVSPRPECLDELLKICRILSKGHPQVRLDFYIIHKKIYFGEITLSTASGLQPMIPRKLDRILGEEIILPAIHS